MLKRIDIHHVTLGMFLHELCGSWLEHPFWRTRFLLTQAKDLERLRATSIRDVWIDVRRGLDVPVQTPCLQFDPQDEQDHSVVPHPIAQASAPEVSTSTELRRASQICSQARDVLQSMFSNARLGKTLDISTAGQLVDEMTMSVKRNPQALISLARIKTADNYTYLHSMAVCALMIALARRMGLDDHTVRKAGMAGLLHDMGKCRIPLEVLNKPGMLDEQEWKIMRAHSGYGYQILQPLGLDEEVLDACLHHHEKVDGTGYPDGLKGDSIGLLARMTAVCDVYDAVTSDRPYKQGWPPSIALQRMAQWSPKHFDVRIFEQFVQTVGIYPLGSLLRLQSQRLAVVIEASSGSLLTPRVKAFYCLRQKVRITPEIVDLTDVSAADSIVAREEPQDWPFKNLESLWLPTTL